MSLESRFKSKCGQPDANGCIPWLGSMTLGKYGVFHVGRSVTGKWLRTTAHRVAWTMKHGEVPDELYVLHRCDNPSCVNVEHLFLGTPKDNTRDMMLKKRHPLSIGEAPWQKLNAVDHERIHDLRRSGCTQQEIADWIGVSRPLISMVLSGAVNKPHTSASH